MLLDLRGPTMTEMNWKLNNTNDLIAVRRAAIITSRIENVSGCQSIPYSKLSSYTSIHMRINDVQINLKHSPLLQYSVYISVYLFFISARQTIKKKSNIEMKMNTAMGIGWCAVQQLARSCIQPWIVLDLKMLYCILMCAMASEFVLLDCRISKTKQKKWNKTAKQNSQNPSTGRQNGLGKLETNNRTFFMCGHFGRLYVAKWYASHGARFIESFHINPIY